VPGQARLSVRQSPLLPGRFSFQDEVGGSSPARPTTPTLTCRNARRSDLSIAAAFLGRLGTAVLQRIRALQTQPLPPRVAVLNPQVVSLPHGRQSTVLAE
jgi:hypothetical protein